MWSRPKSGDAVLQRKEFNSLVHCTDQSKEEMAQPSQEVQKKKKKR